MAEARTTAEIEYVPLEDYAPFECPNDCPKPGDPEFHRCAFQNVVGHKCNGGAIGRLVTHMHVPKKGMGGNNPDAKIRLCGCWAAHDSADNGVKCDGRRYGVELQGRYVRLYDRDDYKRALAFVVDPWAEASSEGAVGEVVAITTADATPAPSPDVSALTRDELRQRYDDASDVIFKGLLVKCEMVQEDYRRSGSWKETASWFEISVRTAEGLAGFAAAVAGTSGLTLENAATIAESRSLVQAIGRRAESDRSAALEAAVDYVAVYGEPPTPAALAHKLGVEAGTKTETVLVCRSCGSLDVVRQ